MAQTKTGNNPVLKASTVEEIKAAIRNSINEANAERMLLDAEREAIAKNPYRDPNLDPACGKIQERIQLWEDAQDTLWEWLRIKNGKA